MADTNIQLAPMKQLLEAVDTDEDWTGLNDPAARRKLQNRLHQRAWRRRKEAQKRRKTEVQSQPIWQRSGQLEPRLIDASAIQSRTQDSHQMSRITTPFDPNPSSVSNIRSLYQPVRTSQLLPEDTPSYSPPYSLNIDSTSASTGARALPGIHTHHDKHGTTIIPPVLPDDPSITVNSTPVAIIFSLPVDQRLITLIQYNVLRATLINVAILNRLHLLPTECNISWTFNPPFSTPTSVPPTFYPTQLQLSTPHNIWIDIIPFASLRDNLILSEGKYDHDELCCDLVGGLYDGFNDVENRGIMIWGEPWAEDGWEVSEGFAAKWGWALKGCRELAEATNKWREKRGEDRLLIEI